jgi:copper chaperone CopZ
MTVAITMKKTATLALIIALAACGQAPQQTADTKAAITPTTHEVSISDGTPMTFADLSINGMTCEMMCGGTIKDALAKLPGVSGTEIKFNEGETADHAIVTYDPAQVSDADLVKAVQALHEGQYKVLAVDITKQVRTTATGTEEQPKTEVEGQVSAAAAEVSDMVLPGILGLLSRLVHL